MRSSDRSRPAPLEGARSSRRRLPDGRARRLDRECRAAVDPEGPELLPREPAVGDQCLRPDVRRLALARRACRRHSWPAAPLHGRARLLRALLAAVRARDIVRDADRVPRGAGRGRGDPVAVRVLDRHRGVRGGQGTQHRTRHPRRHRGSGGVDVLSASASSPAVDLLRQRAVLALFSCAASSGKSLGGVLVRPLLSPRA